MIKSSLLRRILLIVLTTLLMSTIVTSFLYLTFSRKLFTEIKEKELRPQSIVLAQAVLLYNQNIISSYALNELISDWKGFVAIFDSQGEIIYPFYTSDKEVSAFIHQISSQVPITLSGKNTSTVAKLSDHKKEMLVIGTPIIATSDGPVYGAVFVAKNFAEVSATTDSLSDTLVYSFLIMLPFVTLLAYWASYRVAAPLNQMSVVARSMANGNFNILASEAGRGEIGQLGLSLNYLSKELFKTISALTLEKNRLLETINGISEGIIALDKTGNVTHANPAIHRLFNTSTSISSRESLIPYENIWTDFDSVLSDSCSITRNFKYQNKIYVVNLSPLIDEQHKVAGAVGLFRDITEAERLEQTRRDYVANVSHELKTPLTALRGLVEPLKDNLVSKEEDRQRYYDIILRETLRLSRLIDDLLELSRLQSGTISLNRQSFNLSSLLLDMSAKYQFIFEDNHTKFEIYVEDSIIVYSNPDRVEQVLTILLDNSKKFTKEGGLVSLKVEQLENHVLVHVSDTGSGIHEDDIPHLFERFYKVDKSRNSAGTGLGLSIAKEILYHLNEEIRVTSKLGEGSTFSFTIHTS